MISDDDIKVMEAAEWGNPENDTDDIPTYKEMIRYRKELRSRGIYPDSITGKLYKDIIPYEE